MTLTEQQLAEAVEAMARAYDKEDAAQRGEPDPWDIEFDDEFQFEEFRAERLACSQTALTAALPIIEPQWQPIETAPKAPLDSLGEGPSIILFGGFSGNSVRTGHWKAAKTNSWCDTLLGRTPRPPTHWMPLPAPPIRALAEEAR